MQFHVKPIEILAGIQFPGYLAGKIHWRQVGRVSGRLAIMVPRRNFQRISSIMPCSCYCVALAVSPSATLLLMPPRFKVSTALLGAIIRVSFSFSPSKSMFLERRSEQWGFGYMHVKHRPTFCKLHFRFAQDGACLQLVLSLAVTLLLSTQAGFDQRQPGFLPEKIPGARLRSDSGGSGFPEPGGAGVRVFL